MRVPQSLGHRHFTRASFPVSFVVFATVLTFCLPAGAQLVCSPQHLTFGTVQIGQSETQLAILTNTGGTSVTISSQSVGNSEFTVSGLNLPVSVPAGQSVSLNVTFTPKWDGWTGTNVAFANSSSLLPLQLGVAGNGVEQVILTATPSTLSFGQIAVGTSKTIPVVLTNVRNSRALVNSFQSVGNGFYVNGPALPVFLSRGQSITVNVTFAPKFAGLIGGSVFVLDPALAIPLSGTGTPAVGQIGLAPTALAFGNVQTGSKQNLSATITNTGSSSVNISQVGISGTGFSLNSSPAAVTLAAGQSMTFSVAFAPTTVGSASGSLTITSTASNPNASIPLSGTGISPGALGSNPASLSFGNVQTGNTQNLSATVTNTGGSSVTISQVGVNGTGFNLNSSPAAVTLAAGQSATFGVTFAPTAAGTAAGNLWLTSTASNSNLTIPLSGTGISPGALGSNPASLSFGNVQTGSTQNLSATVTNTGGSSVTISQVGVNGAGFSLNGGPGTVTLPAGQSATFSVAFAPTATGNTTGSLTIASTASNSTLTVPLSGAGTSTTVGQLTIAPTKLNFGSVNVGSTATQSLTMSATGGSVTVNSAASGTSQYSISGVSFPFTIAAGQSASVSVVFAPTQGGTASGTLTFLSGTANTQTAESVTGSGVAPQYSVNLSWSASSSSVAGYNVYRGTSPGAYSKINSTLDPNTAYTDSTVASGTTYYYAATSVNSTGQESSYSAPIQVAIP